MLLMRILGSTYLSSMAVLTVCFATIVVGGVPSAYAGTEAGLQTLASPEQKALDSVQQVDGSQQPVEFAEDDPVSLWLQQNAGTLKLDFPKENHQTIDPGVQIYQALKTLELRSKVVPCTGFASAAGIGPAGKLVVDELMRGKYEDVGNLLQGTEDLNKMCPRFGQMNTEEKGHVFALILASMSFLESSCKATAGLKKVVKGPNGRLGGLLQLHLGKEQAYGSNCSNGASKNVRPTLLCGLSMLNKQFVRSGGLINYDEGYWAVLRSKPIAIRNRKTRKVTRVNLSEPMAKIIREFPLCQK